jgi:hypothetical protein
MISVKWHVWSALALAVTLVPTNARAQAFAYTFDDLQRILRVGQPVVVTDQTGREVKGKVADLSTSTLVIRARETRTFSAENVTEIRRTDSDWNGVLIGLGAGYVGMLGFVRQTCGRPGYDDECAAIARPIGWVFIPAGAVLGALIDRAYGNDPVYLGTPSTLRPSVAVSPLCRFSKPRDPSRLSFSKPFPPWD